MKEGLKIAGITLAWWIWVLLLVAIATGAGFFAWSQLYPRQLAVERKAIKESQMRVESITRELRADLVKWQEEQTMIDQSTNEQAIRDLQAQQKALALKMHTDADTLLPDTYNELPADIRQFLKTH